MGVVHYLQQIRNLPSVLQSHPFNFLTIAMVLCETHGHHITLKEEISQLAFGNIWPPSPSKINFGTLYSCALATYLIPCHL